MIRSVSSSTKRLLGLLHNSSVNNFAFLVANVPPEKVYVKKEYLTNFQKGHGEFEEGVWVSAKAKAHKALLLETMLIQYGALYDKLPISAFTWRTDIKPEEQLPLDYLQLWDCLSYELTVIEKAWLRGLHVDVLMKNGKFYKGEYLFTIDFCSSDTNTMNVYESEQPSEHKSQNIIKLENGQFCSQPNNRILWKQASLIPENRLKPYFKACQVDYAAEGSKFNVADSDEYMYLTKEEREKQEKEEKDKKEIAEK